MTNKGSSRDRHQFQYMTKFVILWQKQIVIERRVSYSIILSVVYDVTVITVNNKTPIVT